MHAAALPMSRDTMTPRAPDGLGIGAVLAVLVHLLLVAALALGVNWRAHEPEGVVAELWSAVPQNAAPRATPPPPTVAPVPDKRPAPPPRPAPEPPAAADAKIAIEQAKRAEAKRQADEREALRRLEQQREAQKQKAEREKALAEEARREQLAKEAERQKKELAEKARKEEAALAAQREAYLKRIQGQANATGADGSIGAAVRSSGPSAGYAGRIKARIMPNIVFTESISGNPLATVEVRCAPDGRIVSRKLVRASGNAAWDESVLRAIDKTEVLPRDTDGSIPPVMQIEFRPRD